MHPCWINANIRVPEPKLDPVKQLRHDDGIHGIRRGNRDVCHQVDADVLSMRSSIIYY